MKYSMLACAALFVAGTAVAQEQPAGGMDMSKMGPWSRKPTNEKQTKKEITEFFKAEEELMKKNDFEGSLARYDFPVYMFTDDANGVPEAAEWSREKYAAMMKPFWENMPKDMKMTHKPTVVVLSDSLVTFTDDFTMSQGKNKMSGRSTGVLVKRDGQWKWKVMGEAGWGGMSGAQAEAKPATKK
jgi:hypothetical protein